MDMILITVDLGHFRAYKVVKELLEGPKISLIESYDSVEAHGKLLDKLSDEAGRFRRDGGKNSAQKASGYGEPHSMLLETEKKLLKLIAKDISTLLSREKCETWHLAAPKDINSRIIENLHPDVKTRLDKNIAANLTKFGKAEILKHFEL